VVWRTIVLVQHLLSSLSLGDCSVHRLREDSGNLWFGGQLYYYKIWYRHCLSVTVQYTGYERTLVTCGLEDNCIITASVIVTVFR